jgi:hypothetical protein
MEPVTLTDEDHTTNMFVKIQIKIQVFWDMIMCFLASGFRIVVHYDLPKLWELLKNAASHPSSLGSSATPL